MADPFYSQCPEGNGNIMNAVLSAKNTYSDALGKFSSCSIAAFKRTLLKADLRLF